MQRDDEDPYAPIRERHGLSDGVYTFDRPPFNDDEAAEAFLFICTELGIDVPELGELQTQEALDLMHQFYLYNDAAPRDIVSARQRVMMFDMITRPLGDECWDMHVETATWILSIDDPAEQRKIIEEYDLPRPPTAALELAHARRGRTCRCLGLRCQCG